MTNDNFKTLSPEDAQDFAQSTLRDYLRGDLGEFLLGISFQDGQFVVSLHDPASGEIEVGRGPTFGAAWLTAKPPAMTGEGISAVDEWVKAHLPHARLSVGRAVQ